MAILHVCLLAVPRLNLTLMHFVSKDTLTGQKHHGISMRTNLHSICSPATRLLLIALMASVTFSVSAREARNVQVNIFGDGNPENGVEDSREQILGGRRRGISLADQRMNAGTVKCDGKIRGTAMVLDTRMFAPGLKGVVLASAAHVLYDLEEMKRFKRCEFHFLALGELRKYRTKIDLKKVRMGDFDPSMATAGLGFGEGDWSFLYVPRPWRGYDPDEALTAHDFSFSQSESYRQSGGELRLIAFDSSAGVISVSRDCTVIESDDSDLGGGRWKGQLLDDCDSGGGASGGGIVAVVQQKQYLVGIRSGSHWNAQEFPASKYPFGPPDGAVWNKNSNTNFGRAIDAHILQELQRFAQFLERSETVF